MKTLIVAISLLLGTISCGKGPCGDLAKQVCERAPGTLACEKASRLTAKDECVGYLKDMDKFIELTNLVITTEGVKPPKVGTAGEENPNATQMDSPQGQDK